MSVNQLMPQAFGFLINDFLILPHDKRTVLGFGLDVNEQFIVFSCIYYSLTNIQYKQQENCIIFIGEIERIDWKLDRFYLEIRRSLPPTRYRVAPRQPLNVSAQHRSVLSHYN